jgi:beta-galactosidase GanA
MLYAARVPKAEAAILFSLDTYFMDWIDTTSSEHVRNSLLGLYHAMWDSNIPCDFIHEDELDKLKAYKLIFMPYPIYVEQARAAAIREFVDAGGVVVSEALCGSFGDGCWASRVVPGNGLDEVFCARQDAFGTADEVSVTVHEEDEALPHLQAGDRLTGCRYWETLTPLEGGRVVAAQDGGGPAIVIGSYGKGKTALIGSMMGLSYTEKQHSGTRSMVRGFADWAGVAPPPEVLTAPESFVETRVLESDAGRFLFCFNHGQDTEATVNLEMVPGRYETTEILGKTEATLETESGVLSVKTQIAGGGVKVFLIRPG